eukprot:SAG11_NODE_15463_length_577_cov_1.167364_1_plen_49_part_10
MLIDSAVQVDGKDIPIKVFAGDKIAEVAKSFAIANKLDHDGMQKIYYFL